MHHDVLVPCNRSRSLAVVLLLTLILIILLVENFIEAFLSTKMLILRYSFFFVLIFFPIWGVIYYLLRGREENAGQRCFFGSEDYTQKLKIGRKLLFFMLAFIVVTLVTAYRYSKYFVPQGFDTSFYYITLTRVASVSESRFIELLYSWKRPLFQVIMVAIVKLGVSAEQLYFYYPVMVGYFYVLSVYVFVRWGTGDEKLSLLSLLLAPSSFFFIRLSYDLYANYLGMCFIYVMLGWYLRILRSNDLNRGNIAILVLLVFLAGLIHPYATLIFLAVMFLADFLLMLGGRVCLWGVMVKRKRIFVFTVCGGLLLFIWLLFYLGILFGKLSMINVNAWRTKWYWLAGRESMWVYFFSLIGLVYLVISAKRHYRLLHFSLLMISWVTCISLLLYIPLKFYDEIRAYRVYILYPMGVLQSVGVWVFGNSIRGTIVRIFRFQVRVARLRQLVYAFCVLLILVSVLPSAFIPEYVYYPDGETMRQIRELSRMYGFENGSVVFPVFNSPARPLEPRSSPHVAGWMRAYLGEVVYEGHLLELLNGQPDVHGYVYGDLLGRVIVLADRAYMLTGFEKGLGEEVADGVYEVRVNESLLEGEWLEGYLLSASWCVYNFTLGGGGWVIITRTLGVELGNYTCCGGVGGLLVEVSAGSRGWFTLEKYFDGLNGTGLQSFVLRVYGDFDGVDLVFEAYYASGRVRGKTLRGQSGWLWVCIPVLQGDIITKLRVALRVREPLDSPRVIVLEYVAVLAVPWVEGVA